MAVIQTILWAQWKSIRILRFGAGRKGALFSGLTSMFWYGFWTLAALGVSAFTSDPQSRRDIETLLPAILIFVVIYWQLAPVLVASLGASLDLKKLLVYPIPTENLFWVEVMLRVTTGLEMLLILTGTAAGLIRNPVLGGWVEVPRIVAALLLFVIFNLLLAAGLRSLIERLLGHKRLREVFVLLLVMVGALPQLLLVTGVPKGALRRMFSENSSVLWPWIATARDALPGAGDGSFAGGPGAGFLEVAAVPAAFGAASRPRSGDRGKRAAHAVPHAAIPAGVCDGLHVRAGGVASADLRKAVRAFIGGDGKFPDPGVPVRVVPAGAGDLLELVRIRPVGGAGLFRLARPDLAGDGGEECGGGHLRFSGNAGGNRGVPVVADAAESA